MSRLEILKRLCKSREISINKLEQELGVSQGSLGKIDSNVPKADKLYAIAQYFQVPMEVFFEESADGIAEKYANAEPVYDIAAGEGRINGQYPTEYMEEETMEGYSWCEIHGDSMSPILLDGDYVKVQHMTQTEPTDLTVVKVDGESATVKYVEITDSGVVLRAENKEVYEDHYFSVSEVITLPVTIVGKVVEMKRKF